MKRASYDDANEPQAHAAPAIAFTTRSGVSVTVRSHGREIKHDGPHPPLARPGTTIGVRVASVAGAAVAALAAVLGSAPYPAQGIVASAASCGFLAVLLRPTKASRSDWVTVRVLLALNLIVFGISYAHRLDIALAASAIGLGLVLLILIIGAQLNEHLHHRRER